MYKEEKNQELMEIRLLFPKLEEEFGSELNSTRSNLQDANAKLQKSLTTINSSLVEKVRRAIYISEKILSFHLICQVSH